MRKTKLIAAALCASLLVPFIGLADAFNPKAVPADAKWVVHADLDAARDTKSFDAIWQRVFADANARTQIDQIEQISGMKIPEDLDDVTLYGREAGDDAGVVMVHGKIDKAQTMTSLKFADDFTSTPYGAYKVMSWLDKGKNQTMFGAFHDGSNVIIGHTEKNIEAALDVMDGKAESIKADSPLAAGAKPQLLMYVAAKDVAQLHAAGEKPNPIVGSVESAWISLSEKDDIVTLRAELQGANADSAADLRESLDGLKGMLRLAAKSDNPDPVATAVVAASKTFATTQKDRSVVIEWPIPIEQVKTIITAVADKRGLKN